MKNADKLAEGDLKKRPYWRERKAGSIHLQEWSLRATVRDTVALLEKLDNRAYFEKRTGKDCVDDPQEIDLGALLEKELGETSLWPFSVDRLAEDEGLFFDVVEAIHDLVSRPRNRSMHSYAGCGWHHSDFESTSARKIYRWHVNRLFSQGGVTLRLADEGEDVGRLVARTDEEREDLIRATASRPDAEDSPGGQVRHAIRIFRARGADRNDKRSAVAALALVLEERRHDVLAETLAKSDRGALFEIANNFHVRHQDAKQKRQYDDFYLDWVFWVYLSTIELTNRVLDEQGREGQAYSGTN
jgi:hypothetical protein